LSSSSPTPTRTLLKHLPSSSAARARVNARIDAVVKNPKSKSRKKARKGEEDDLEQMADDLIQNLKEKMMAAAQKDEEAVLAKRPATAKLMMLKEVMGVLQQ
jgi:transcription factor SPN1